MVLKIKSVVFHLNSELWPRLAPASFSNLVVMLTSCFLCPKFCHPGLFEMDPLPFQGLYLYSLLFLRTVFLHHSYQHGYISYPSCFSLIITQRSLPCLHTKGKAALACASIIGPSIIQMTRKKLVKKMT